VFFASKRRRGATIGVVRPSTRRLGRYRDWRLGQREKLGEFGGSARIGLPFQILLEFLWQDWLSHLRKSR
jgi:hypothetical protein